MADIIKQVENEIIEYTSNQIQIAPGILFSQYSTVNRISMFQNKQYSSGNIDSFNKPKYWFDIVQSRVDGEVKNIDFDTKDIKIVSEQKKDIAAVMLLNSFLRDWMKENEEGVKLNDIIESSTAWGNVLLKKTKDGYEKLDLKNVYLTNQSAKTVNDTAIIERHVLNQSKLRAKKGVWDSDKVEEAIKSCSSKTFSTTKDANVNVETQTPFYEVYERNGEVSVACLKTAQGKNPTNKDEESYVLAKIIFCGLDGNVEKTDKRVILFAEEIKEMPYKEYHRGPYNGRWFREGFYEKLFDHQTRANEIGNQIARGLEWSSKIVFRSSDRTIAQNILSDIQRGDIIKSSDLQQVDVRMQGLDQLIADWNRIMQQADSITNSYEVVTGESLPSGTPFRLGAMMNQNANKLFDMIREKLGLAIKSVYNDWILKDIIKQIKRKEVLKITGDTEYMNRFRKILIDGWYLRNMIAIGPQPPEVVQLIKQQKVAELAEDKNLFIKIKNEVFEDLEARIDVIITGESSNIDADVQTLSTLIQLEADPMRRQAMLEQVMAKKGIDFEGLPQAQPVQQPQLAQA